MSKFELEKNWQKPKKKDKFSRELQKLYMDTFSVTEFSAKSATRCEERFCSWINNKNYNQGVKTLIRG